MSGSISRRIQDNGLFKHTIYIDQLYEFSLAAFLCFPAINFLFGYILRYVGLGSLSHSISLLIVYIPVIVVAIKKRRITIDFWLIWFALVLFFLLTYLIHPNYEPWYTKDDYGVLDYVISPENGLYIYLLIRLVNDPERIIRSIKLSSWPMFFYSALQIIWALARGYWVDFSNKGYEIHLSYNLSLGYSLLIFTITFLYCALEQKKLIDWIGVAIGSVLILLAGSRGPILDIVIFLVIYVIIKIGKSRKKVYAIVGITVIGILFYIAYPFLMTWISILLNRLNIHSRFFEKLLNGTLSDDSGRLIIWKAALNMIKENPFGYGAMGSRHVISQYVYVGHPHDFFLEVLIDFGVIIGIIIIAWLFYWVIKLLSTKDNDAWRGVFLIFFSRACQLLLSLTFWHSIGLWGTLAVGICMWRDCKRKRRILNVGK